MFHVFLRNYRANVLSGYKMAKGWMGRILWALEKMEDSLEFGSNVNEGTSPLSNWRLCQAPLSWWGLAGPGSADPGCKVPSPSLHVAQLTVA